MILPTKHLRADRALLSIGADILKIINEPKTISRVWDEFRIVRSKKSNPSPINYDWFIMAIDLLFIMDALTYERGLLRKNRR